MGQVAFDTQEFVETLENAGLNREQAKAITLVVRESHEVADLATKADIKDVKRDLEDARKDLSAEIANVRKDLSAEISTVKRDLEDVRKEIEFRFEKTDAQIADARKETATQIALLRKDVESISTWLLIKMAAMMTALLGVAVTLVKILI
ncbi:putative phage protein [Candidatus Sodalis pierantonius str. SOPE]|uniref:Putative phage protein n=1 Tax=Candidatus Sodalis pierantonii str. SOPE TaxID=2342 RepID=W0HQK3_9GAMM|nr:hypothetical protein [Candidatus Sodalis pierantonius]AHF74465.1 putative phage protein [Candidatus Sodalis pierantonius str. SOPE]